MSDVGENPFVEELREEGGRLAPLPSVNAEAGRAKTRGEQPVHPSPGRCRSPGSATEDGPLANPPSFDGPSVEERLRGHDPVPLEDQAVFHHEAHVAKGVDVVQGISETAIMSAARPVAMGPRSSMVSAHR